MNSTKQSSSIRSITTLRNKDNDYQGNERTIGHLVKNHEEWSGTDNSNRKFFQHFNENSIISNPIGLRNDINPKLIYSYPPSNIVFSRDKQIKVNFQTREKRFPIILTGMFH